MKKNKNKNSNPVTPAVLDAAPAAVLDQAPQAPLSDSEQAAAVAQLQEEVPAAAPEAPAPAPATPAVSSKRDAFGGRLGTRMSNINVAVINAGATGATIAEVAAATGESKSLVSSQLCWMVAHNKGATRTQETVNGKKQFRYFAANALLAVNN